MLVVMGAAGVVVVCVRCSRTVDVPHALERRQDQAIEDRTGRLEHTHYAIGMLVVTLAAFFETVRA